MDQDNRKPGISYWPEEEITAGDIHRALEGGPVDVMLTHDDAPQSLCPVPGIDDKTFPFPRHRLAPAKAHSKIISRMVEELQPSELFHGHFHVYYQAGARLKSGKLVSIMGLACDGMNGNIALYTP